MGTDNPVPEPESKELAFILQYSDSRNENRLQKREPKFSEERENGKSSADH
jgi:hypothetical protein